MCFPSVSLCVSTVSLCVSTVSLCVSPVCLYVCPQCLCVRPQCLCVRPQCVSVCVLSVSLCVSPVCGCDLSRGGSFLRSGDYLCTLDYQRLHGTRCQGCGEYVEGEVVTALGKAYHPACFVCTSCR